MVEAAAVAAVAAVVVVVVTKAQAWKVACVKISTFTLPSSAAPGSRLLKITRAMINKCLGQHACVGRVAQIASLHHGQVSTPRGRPHIGLVAAAGFVDALADAAKSTPPKTCRTRG